MKFQPQSTVPSTVPVPGVMLHFRSKAARDRDAFYHALANSPTAQAGMFLTVGNAFGILPSIEVQFAAPRGQEAVEPVVELVAALALELGIDAPSVHPIVQEYPTCSI